MLISRNIQRIIETALNKEPRVLIIYGPRQAGKTTLINQIISKLPKEKIAFFNGDDLRTLEAFAEANLDLLKKTIGVAEYLIIDEAQRIENIGLKIKLIFDNLKIKIILSGSSSFDLANKTNEPLTGRSTTFSLYPINVNELKPQLPSLSLNDRLEEFLTYGMYPKVLTSQTNQEKEQYLFDLINSYLYKDILSFEKVRKPKVIVDLLSLLALQIGNEVSISELSQHLAISKQTTEKYLDVLEKMFVILNLRGFSRNLRKEIYKTSKYYFTDLGLRNGLIRNFNPLKLRDDKGSLLENFFFIERLKFLNNQNKQTNFYFWRTYDQKEIDLIEEKEGKIIGWEVKWSEQKYKTPNDWLKAYPQANITLVNKENIFGILNHDL
ncbi:MAG: ATP-binding protein [bacterium]|nr:ATP-binding protein [bacterium]